MKTLKAIVKEITDQFAKLVKGMISYHTSCIFLIYILCIKEDKCKETSRCTVAKLQGQKKKVRNKIQIVHK